jgi:hypothetical protein
MDLHLKDLLELIVTNIELLLILLHWLLFLYMSMVVRCLFLRTFPHVFWLFDLNYSLHGRLLLSTMSCIIISLKYLTKVLLMVVKFFGLFVRCRLSYLEGGVLC